MRMWAGTPESLEQYFRPRMKNAADTGSTASPGLDLITLRGREGLSVENRGKSCCSVMAEDLNR